MSLKFVWLLVVSMLVLACTFVDGLCFGCIGNKRGRAREVKQNLNFSHLSTDDRTVQYFGIDSELMRDHSTAVTELMAMGLA